MGPRGTRGAMNLAGTPWRREALVILCGFALNPLAAALASGDRAVAVAHASDLVGVQRSVGWFPEPAVAGWAAEMPWLLGGAGAFYLAAHVPVTVAVLAWVLATHPARYALVRTTWLLTQVTVLAVNLAWPVAPPRMLAGEGFADSLTGVWGPGAARAAGLLQSPYAAFPSGHAAFAVVAGGALGWLAGAWWLRALGALYTVSVVTATVITANHFWLDAAAGGVVVALTGAAAYLRSGRAGGRSRRGDPGGGRARDRAAAPA